jgi:adenosine deaminase
MGEAWQQMLDYLGTDAAWQGRNGLPALLWAHLQLSFAALAIAAVVLVGFRVTINVADSGVIDVGYAGAVGADRIAHGVRAAEDPTVLARLAERGIACDLCPTSNAVLGVAPGIAGLPLARFLGAGVPITLNTDDRLFFGSGVAAEYAAVRDAFGLSDAELAAIARTSADVSGAPAATVARIHHGIDAWLAAPA